MRCPECNSNNVITDENGYKICSNCGLVIEEDCRLESSHSLLLNNTPIAPTSLLGTDIAPGHFNNLEITEKIRRCHRYLQQPYSKERDALFQLKKLKLALDVSIPDTTLIEWFKKIRKNYNSGMHISAKNVASVIFYVVAKEYKINFSFRKYLEAAELSKSRFWQIFQALNLKHRLAKNIYDSESLEYYNAADLTKIQQELTLSPQIVDYARQVLCHHRFSSLSRINVGAALLAAQQHFKRRGQLSPKDLPASKIWKALKVAPSTIYGKVNDFMRQKAIKTPEMRQTVRSNPFMAQIASLMPKPSIAIHPPEVYSQPKRFIPQRGHLRDWLTTFVQPNNSSRELNTDNAQFHPTNRHTPNSPIGCRFTMGSRPRLNFPQTGSFKPSEPPQISSSIGEIVSGQRTLGSKKFFTSPSG